MQSASRGRRPGTSGTRQAIARAARRQFSELGYVRASLRSIAAEAEVDSALIAHFYGSKARLFVEAVGLPFDPDILVAQIIRGPRRAIGVRLARTIASLLEEPETRARIIGLVRAAASEPEAALMVRDLISERILGPIARQLGVDRARLRANLAGSQVVGLVMARHVVGVEPLASLPADELVTTIAPTFQRYLTAPLG